MKIRSFLTTLFVTLVAPSLLTAENLTERHGGLIGMLYPSQYERADRVAVEWMALTPSPLVGLSSAALVPCNKSWRRGQENAQCDEVFVPLRSNDSGAFVESPRFLSSLRSFSYGTGSKTAYGMDIPGLVDTLRAQLRTPDYPLSDLYAVGNPNTR